MAATKYTWNQFIGANLDRYTDAPEFELGTIVESAGGKRYRYVRFVDAVTYAQGQVVTLASTGWSVTNDRVGGSDISLVPVGVLHSDNVPTQDQYGWVQISGVASVRCAGAGIAAGDILVAHGTTDGSAAEADYTSVAHADFKTVGIALAAIADGTSGSVLLNIVGA